MAERKYDSTVARMAGNLLSGVLTQSEYFSLGLTPAMLNQKGFSAMVRGAVALARAIVAETQRQEVESAKAIDSASVAVNADR